MREEGGGWGRRRRVEREGGGRVKEGSAWGRELEGRDREKRGLGTRGGEVGEGRWEGDGGGREGV